MKKKSEAKAIKSFDSIDLIKGLLKSLQLAHSDRNMILFERVKAVISMMVKGSGSHEQVNDEDSEIKQNKIIMTEVMG